ncbi:MAG: glutamate racemase [Candidatus Gottesmanbacteria bacterium]|nr:glutamate racemase [Candidatus Gottesmanbacteria bacterium]
MGDRQHDRQHAPIGFLDSGLGGLTIWDEVRSQLPSESTIYIGDHEYQPYGKRRAPEIRRRVKRLIGFLLQKKVKMVVIACNTATVTGIDLYRRWYPRVPIIGVVPVVKTAVSLTKTKHIAVLSTPNTAGSTYQKRLITMYAGDCTVENIGIPDLATSIERGDTNKAIEKIVRKYLDPVVLHTVDVIVLGCTHYPFIRPVIARLVGEKIRIIDSGAAVGRHVTRVLDQEQLRSVSHAPYTEFYTTGDAAQVSRVASGLLARALSFTYARL